MRILFFLLWATTAVFAQKSEPGTPQPDRTANAGKVTFSTYSYNFGTVAKDSVVTAQFVLKNTSKEDMLLLSVMPMCHCTTAEWPRDPVVPGGEAVIRIMFHAERVGEFYKLATIKTNFDPEQPIAINVKGIVK